MGGVAQAVLKKKDDKDVVKRPKTAFGGVGQVLEKPAKILINKLKPKLKPSNILVKGR